MQIDKEKTKVRIKTDSAVIIGYAHHMPDGRLSDYFSAQVAKFIPITSATVYPLNYTLDEKDSIQKREVVFINTDRIEIVEYY